MTAEMPQALTVLETMGLVKPALKALAAELRTSAKFAAQGPLAEMSAQVTVATLEALMPELQRLARGN
jgi:hypothetical protein